MRGFIYSGALLGIVLGGLAGASVGSWSGALVGGYGGMVCGASVIGGLGTLCSPGYDSGTRAEAGVAFAFGVAATAGSIIGYRLAGSSLPWLSPLWGYVLGLIVPGVIAGGLWNVRGPSAGHVLLLYFLAPLAAGVGAWLGTLAGSPWLVGIGLVVGTVVGGNVAHALSFASPHPTPEEIRDRFHDGGGDLAPGGAIEPTAAGRYPKKTSASA